MPANVADTTLSAVGIPVEPWSDGFSEDAPVGSLLPNNFGLHDMLGNVSEWCLDAYSIYESTPAEDEPLRMQRGGSFAELSGPARSSYRHGAEAWGRWQYGGVRAAWTLDG